MTTEPNIAPAAAATVTHGVFHNPGYAGPVPSSAVANNPGRLAESVVHESMRGDIEAGMFTVGEANAILKRDGYNVLGIALRPAAPSPVAPSVDRSAVLQAAKRKSELMADKDFVARWGAGDKAARDEVIQLNKTIGDGTDALIAAAAPAEPVAPAVDPNDPLGVFAPAADHEIKIPSLVEVQAQAVARGEARGGDVELFEAVERAKGYGMAAELPATDVNAIAARGPEVEAAWSKLDDPGRHLHNAHVNAQLQTKWGAKTADMIGLAKLVTEAAEESSPGVKAFLHKSGLGSDYETIVRLAEHGARLLAKQGKTVADVRAQFSKLFT